MWVGMGMGMGMGGCGAMSCRVVTSSWREMGCSGVCFTVSLSLRQTQRSSGCVDGWHGDGGGDGGYTVPLLSFVFYSRRFSGYPLFTHRECRRANWSVDDRDVCCTTTAHVVSLGCI